MAATSAIIHLLALLALFGLSWLLLVRQQQLALLRRLLFLRRQPSKPQTAAGLAASAERIHFEGPEKLLRRLASACGFAYQPLRGSREALPARIIRLAVLADFLKAVELRAIEERRQISASQPGLEFIFAVQVGSRIEGWSERLSRALGVPCRVLIAAEEKELSSPSEGSGEGQG